MRDAFTRAATIAPATADDDARTVEVVWSTGAPVSRRDASGPYVERLSLDPAHVDLSRLDGAPVLNSHRGAGIEDVLGVVEAPRVEGGRGTARIRFSRRPDVDPVWQDVRAGILRGVSVGYRVETWSDAVDPATRARTRTAVRWTPFEVSLVPVPADPAATVRSEEAHMDDQHPAGAPAGDTLATRAQANAEIRSIARIAGLDHAFADAQIDAGATVDQVRAAAFAEMAKRSGPTIRTEATRVEFVHSHDDPAEVRRAMSDAVAARMMHKAPEGRAREFADFGVADMVADLAARRGFPLGTRNRVQIVEAIFSRSAAHSTSDFPLLLADAGNKVLQARYQAAPPTYRQWAAQRGFNDFKPHKMLRLGDFPSLQPVGEAGEVKFGTLSEDREQVTPREYATGIAINRRALVNDDLGAFAEFTQMIAVRVAQDENAMVYAQIANDGPALADGTALFATGRGNKAGAGAAIDVDSIGAAVAAMRKVKSLDGIALNLAPRFLVVGPDRETAARRFVASVTPTRAADVNPWAGALELVVDANVTGNRWHLFADPAAAPVIAYGYVAGQAGPQVRSEIDFDTRALKVAVGLDFGAGPIDWRGAYLNTGA
jgi:hypothetical protein